VLTVRTPPCCTRVLAASRASSSSACRKTDTQAGTCVVRDALDR
jgi:hypothetical protein